MDPARSDEVLSKRRVDSGRTGIPRRLMSLDEQHLRQCLEFMCGKASKVIPFDAPLALASSAVDGNSELWKELVAVSRPHETGDSKVDSARSLPGQGTAAADPKSRDLFDKRTCQSPFYLADRHSANPVLRECVSSFKSSGRSLSSGAAESISQGMLLFRWMDGMPSFVFSQDERHEVYVADLMRVQSSDHVEPDYKYLIRCDENDKKMRKGSCFVGEISLSTSTSVCSDDAEIRTTEFVLFGGYEIPADEEGSVSTTKGKGFSGKAVNAFTGNSLKRQDKARRTSKGVAVDSWRDKIKLIESHSRPGNELSAVIVKNHVKGDGAATRPKPEAGGGWGLKFLRKVEAARLVSCSGELSGSMDVIIPAGLHGGPRRTTTFEGPSSLIERWKSGGKCDCGGWDLGCPLTLLQARFTDSAGDLRSMDIVGLDGSNTMLRMTNVRDDLFLVRFDRTLLSALQSLSAAIAYVHTNSPLLQQTLLA